MINNNRLNKFFFYIFLTILFLFFIGSLINDRKLEDVFSLIFLLICISPFFLFAFNLTSFISAKFFTLLTFFCISVSLIMTEIEIDFINFFFFFSNFFLIIIVILFLFAILEILLKVIKANKLKHKQKIIDQDKKNLLFELKLKKQPLLFKILLIALIFIVFPIFTLMFEFKVGITGIPSANLPFFLTSILIFFSKYIFPFLIFYLYANTNRNSILVVSLIIFCAIFIGTATSSRSLVLALFAGPVILSFYDKKWGVFFFSLIFFFVTFSIITISRDEIFFVDDMTLNVVSGVNISDIISISISKLNFFEMLKAPFIFFGRILEFDSLYNLWSLASIENINIINYWMIMIKSELLDTLPELRESLEKLEIDLYKKDLIIGTTTLPQNFFFRTFLALHSSKISYFIFGGTFFLIMSSLELLILNLQKKYKVYNIYILYLLFFSTLVFITSPDNNQFYRFFFMCLILFLFPKIKKFHRFLKYLHISH
jgi:hypothetical protein